MSNYLKDLEDSRLLFRTFCDGLMYGMFFYHGENLHRVASIEGLGDTVNGVYPIKECKPCLRSISKLTKEELNECVGQSGIRDVKCPNWNDLPKEKHFEARLNHSINMFLVDSRTIDWLNVHHFDYRGLIPMGLALEAPEGMYRT